MPPKIIEHLAGKNRKNPPASFNFQVDFSNSFTVVITPYCSGGLLRSTTVSQPAGFAKSPYNFTVINVIEQQEQVLTTLVDLFYRFSFVPRHAVIQNVQIAQNWGQKRQLYTYFVNHKALQNG